MNSKESLGQRFTKWKAGDFLRLPITDNFALTSPFGTFKAKKQYIDLLMANKVPDKIVAYDNIEGEISDERKLNNLQ
jgi:hypothetical protein